ncbi:DUF4870 domain-containing protein [Chitinophaga sp. GbtcB8]|uniref:DUF4870 domain-containing protein n=1 Tax=Chitinophaga sp. GbtcB8 TaxID=2824753 RepID=UPI001C2F3AC8|nr:DUF4870 domain-containing protein [Chitinophaga sp. GbtcB8]
MDQNQERTWGALVHLGGLIGMFILSFVGNIIGALVMWLIKRNESAFIDDQGKEALNFQITLSLVNVAIGLLISLRHGIWAFRSIWRDHDFDGWHSFGSAISLYGIVSLLNIIFSIIAAVRANKGIRYRYPLCLRIVK